MFFRTKGNSRLIPAKKGLSTSEFAHFKATRVERIVGQTRETEVFRTDFYLLNDFS